MVVDFLLTGDVSRGFGVAVKTALDCVAAASTVGGGLTSLHADEIKFALRTGPEVCPEEPKHSNGPTVKNESWASEENCSIFTGNEDLSVKYPIKEKSQRNMS